jgi:uncharacterized protein (TIGR00369 family)
LRPLPRYRPCFVCGRENTAGLDLCFYRDGRKVHCDWTPAARHLGYPDRAHGGVTAAVLDEAMGWAPAAEVGRLLYTVEVCVKYRRPIAAGGCHRVEAELVDAASRLVRTTGRILDADGAVCATATGLYLPLPTERADEVLRHLYLEGEDRPVTRADL